MHSIPLLTNAEPFESVFSYPRAISSPQIGPLVQHMHRFGLSGLLPPQHLYILVILEALAVFCSSYRISGMLVISDILRGILVVYKV